MFVERGPEPADLERLRSRFGGRIVTADVRDGSRIGDVLSDAGGHGVRFEIVYGGITRRDADHPSRASHQDVAAHDGLVTPRSDPDARNMSSRKLFQPQHIIASLGR